MPARRNRDCRYCHSENLTCFLSLGKQPPSNSFLRPEQIPLEERYPLDVYLCGNCFLVQLLDVVPAEIIFDDYLYLSSTSQALKNHYRGLVELASTRFQLKQGDVVVDIGCNDGILLHGYSLQGIVRVGVEPSKVSEIALASGLEVVKSFFGPHAAETIVQKHGHAKIVTATNVFAHVDHITEFVESLHSLLSDDGVFIVEAPYLIDLIDQTLFDTIYHEHLCYLSLTPMVPFLEQLGFQIFDVERVPIGASGPAIRVFIRRNQNKLPEPSVSQMLEDEEKWGIRNITRYTGYAEKVQHIKKESLSLLSRVKAEGVRIGGYTAPAKGNTLLNYLELTSRDIECIADNNAMKQGLLTPGSHIPVVSEDDFLKRMPEYALLLGWNYLEFFLEKSEYIRRGGKFIVPVPDPRILPYA